MCDLFRNKHYMVSHSCSGQVARLHPPPPGPLLHTARRIRRRPSRARARPGSCSTRPSRRPSGRRPTQPPVRPSASTTACRSAPALQDVLAHCQSWYPGRRDPGPDTGARHQSAPTLASPTVMTDRRPLPARASAPVRPSWSSTRRQVGLRSTRHRSLRTRPMRARPAPTPRRNRRLAPRPRTPSHATTTTKVDGGRRGRSSWRPSTSSPTPSQVGLAAAGARSCA